MSNVCYDMEYIDSPTTISGTITGTQGSRFNYRKPVPLFTNVSAEYGVYPDCPSDTLANFVIEDFTDTPRKEKSLLFKIVIVILIILLVKMILSKD